MIVSVWRCNQGSSREVVLSSIAFIHRTNLNGVDILMRVSCAILCTKYREV